MSKIEVFAGSEFSGEYHYLSESKEHIFNYLQDNPVSLVMPYTPKSYVSYVDFIPVFDQFMPEGWLYRVLRDMLAKRFEVFEEFDIFKTLAPAVEGFLTFKVEEKTTSPKSPKPIFRLSEVLKDDFSGIFQELVRAFLTASPLGGVQPKVLAEFEDDEKGVLRTKKFVVKAFGKQFFLLTENERLSLLACVKAGLEVPRFWLSQHGRLFVIERFDLGESPFGFEEFASLFWKTRERKYDGSYEAVAKALRKISANPEKDLERFFKLLVMNFLLKNGDAHLKNFGVLYSYPYANDVRLAPVYDVVCTWIYDPTDQPALTMFGRKVWFSRSKLEEFGRLACGFSAKRVRELFEDCLTAAEDLLIKVRTLKKNRPEWKKLYDRFETILEFSLGANLKNTVKELPHELRGPWKEDTRKTSKTWFNPGSPGL